MYGECGCVSVYLVFFLICLDNIDIISGNCFLFSEVQLISEPFCSCFCSVNNVSFYCFTELPPKLHIKYQTGFQLSPCHGLGWVLHHLKSESSYSIYNIKHIFVVKMLTSQKCFCQNPSLSSGYSFFLTR